MSSRTTRRPLAIGAALLSLLAAAPTQAASLRTKVATCDELAGQTEALNDRWRLFNPDPAEFETGLVACRRGPGPARRILEFGNYYSVPRLVGNLAQLNNSGRYNSQGLVVDLSTLRFQVIYEDNPYTQGQLLASGAILTIPQRPLRPGDPVPTTPLPAGEAQPLWGDLTATDASGSRILTSGPAAPNGSTLMTTVAPFGHSGGASAGLYVTAVDGTLQRHVVRGAADSSAFPGRRLQATWRPYRERLRRAAGLTWTALPDTDLQLATQARRGRSASLTLRRTFSAETGRRIKRPRVIARLAPGSAGALKTLPGGVVIARFADAPTGTRLRIPDPAAPGRYLIDLPAPAVFDPDAYVAATNGVVAYRYGATITFIVPKGPSGRPEATSVPAPNGSHDYGVAPVPYGTNGPDPAPRLFYTDDLGTPLAVPVPTPGT